MGPAQQGAHPCPTCQREDAIPADFPGARACIDCAVTGWLHLEPRYAAGIYVGTGEHPGQVRYVDGDDAVLFTATNGVHYYRGKTMMPANRRTGSGAEVLAALTGTRSLTVVREPSVPSAALLETMQGALIEHVGAATLVVDLKGMADRNTEICVGLGPMPGPVEERFAQFVIERMQMLGVRATINAPFAGMGPTTVTKYCQTTVGVPAVQVALSAWMRDPEQNPAIAKMALSVLRDAVAHVR